MFFVRSKFLSFKYEFHKKLHICKDPWSSSTYHNLGALKQYSCLVCAITLLSSRVDNVCKEVVARICNYVTLSAIELTDTNDAAFRAEILKIQGGK
jgi:hypothetical protein